MKESAWYDINVKLKIPCKSIEYLNTEYFYILSALQRLSIKVKRKQDCQRKATPSLIVESVLGGGQIYFS